MTARDPRCSEGDCDFPNCNCEHPPFEVWQEDVPKTMLLFFVVAIVIAIAITIGWFYLVGPLNTN